VQARRHFQQLNTNKAAKVVGLSAAGAGQRRVRAPKHLTNTLDVLPGTMGEV